MTPIWKIADGLNVAPLAEQLEARPEVWNRHRQRTEAYGTPHEGVSDVWCRYRDWSEYTGDWAAFHGEHESKWYPDIAKIPAAWSLARKVQRMVGLPVLGGVLITKIPPGGCVKAHIDGGWHAAAHRKFGVQVIGHQDQVFWFENEDGRTEHRPATGEVYEFKNDVLHGVENNSDTPRITLIVCAR